MKKTVVAVCFLAFSISGCVTNPPRPAVQQAIYDLKINNASRDEIFVEDIGISLKPILLERAKNTESLFATYRYWNPANPRQNGVGKDIMISLPAFEVQVTNTSGHAVNFQKTSIRLIDDAGNSYQAQLKQDVLEFVDQQLNSVQSRGWALDRTTAQSAARSLKLFDKNYESIPGIIEKRILAFDTNNATNENAYRQMLRNTKYLKIIMHTVPVKFDQAGNVTRVSKFEYVFDVSRK